MTRGTARSLAILSRLELAVAAVAVAIAVLLPAGVGTASAQAAPTLAPTPTPMPMPTPPAAATPAPLSPPTNIVSVNGANPGEVNLTWGAAGGARFYRVGWIVHADVAAAGANRRVRFVFAERGDRTAFTQARLAPGADYWFIVAGKSEPNEAPRWAAQWTRLKLATAPEPSPCTGTELRRLVKPALAQISDTVTADDADFPQDYSGSGFIVRADGLLAANAHLVRDYKTGTVAVRLQNGKTNCSRSPAACRAGAY